MRTSFYFLISVFLSLSPKAGADLEEITLLEGLNKTTGRVFKLEVPMGANVKWGNLEIKPTRCVKAAPEQLPENSVFLEVRDVRHPIDSQPLFRGWMFSSSPSLSSLEHPIYDIIVLDCYSLPQPNPETGVSIESLPPVEPKK